MKIRLQIYLARAGISPSRRKAEELIKQGKVLVNGKTAKLGDKVEPGKDSVSLSGKSVEQVSRKLYIMVNKPSGYLVAKSDSRGRKLAYDLLKKPSVKNEKLTEQELNSIFNVGRLDLNSEGLLLFTNDGEFSLRLMHPRYHVKKVYIAKVEGKITDAAAERLKAGIEIKIEDVDPKTQQVKIERYRTLPAEVRVLGRGKENYSVVLIKLREGRKRQVRRMMEAIGFPVISLKRIEIGKLKLGNLPVGNWRFLTKDEVKLKQPQQ